MPDPQPLDYATPEPRRPSRLWIIARILIALPLAAYAVGGLIVSCSALERGDPGTSLGVFLIVLVLVGVIVLVFNLPVTRRKDDPNRN